MTRAFHGTGEQAIKWLVEEYREFEHDVFLRMWHEGDAEAEWPEFYEWLDRQPAIKVSNAGDQLADCAALLINVLEADPGPKASASYAAARKWWREYDAALA